MIRALCREENARVTQRRKFFQYGNDPCYIFFQKRQESSDDRSDHCLHKVRFFSEFRVKKKCDRSDH